MHAPEQLPARSLGAGRHVLPAYLPIPGAGVLPVNAFVLTGRQPVLVDTGVRALRPQFLSALTSVVDPAELNWIWITHADADHIGNLEAVLALAPRATVVTSFLGLAKLGLMGLQPPRVHLLNPGQVLEAGDRQLLATRPPVYDAPETCGAFETASRTLLSADSLGALLQAPQEWASDLGPDALRAGMLAWAMVDAPWLRSIDRAVFARTLDAIDVLNVELVLSAHLPPASRMTGTLLEFLQQAPEASPFVGPDQAAFERMMAGAAA